MGSNNAIREAVILGALLHDIGKFVQRAKDNPKRPKQNHSYWGTVWFQENLAERLTVIFAEEGKQINRNSL